MSDTLKYQIAVTQLKEVGSKTAKNLITHCGNAEAVFKASAKQLIHVPNIGKAKVEAILASKEEALKRAGEELDFIHKNNITPLFYTDVNFPKRLLQFTDSPIMLYFKGKANLNNTKIISIVGTRKITDYGKKMCENFIETVAPYQPLIVSGLAYGVDIAAHKSALKNNLPTIAVVANGMDKMYPAQHIKYVKEMVENGGVLTEYMSGQVADKQNFPQRNRIVAGMCDALIVVETAIKGGAMITATLANSYNKDVFTFPGRSFDEFSKGCNYLIKTNQANLIENADDFVNAMFWDGENVKQKTKILQPELFTDLSETEKIILQLVQQNAPINMDDLAIHTAYSQTDLASIILALELKGILKMLPGKYFALN